MSDIAGIHDRCDQGTRVDTFSLFSNADVGSYPVNFLSSGTAANYTITTKPGALTITRKPLVYTGPTLTTSPSYIPALDPQQPRLVSGGPRFRVVGSLPATYSSGSTVPISLTIVLEAGTSMADITSKYSITLIPGSLEIQPFQCTTLTVPTINLSDFKHSLQRARLRPATMCNLFLCRPLAVEVDIRGRT